MSDSRRRPRTLCITLAGLAAALSVALPAEGQVGNVRRRVRDAVVRPPDTLKTKCDTVVLDTLIVELTTARVDQVIKGLRASRTVLNGRAGAPGWDALTSRRDAAMAEVATLSERHHDEITAHTERRTRIDQCREVAFAELAQERKDPNRVMSDPALMLKYSELSQRMLDAQQRGDTAAVKRIQAEVEALVAPPREDSLAVDRKCGRSPAPLPAAMRIDSLRVVADTLNAQLRRLEEQAYVVAAQASGLTPGQMAMGRERAEMYLAWSKASGGSRVCGFTQVELAALKARQAELAELL